MNSRKRFLFSHGYFTAEAVSLRGAALAPDAISFALQLPTYNRAGVMSFSPKRLNSVFV
jgi:hypothetical protein